ncbi:RNA polymerase sigma factor [Streptomyces sp. I4(2020)]|uniref:RNA polymerase sigma factor n=1 Tax=Streptomyces sp. I4(2020) TaxID=2760981 RepID=UPI0018EE9E1F|nr:sigma-70 family RNA polymerase sigma factor [Streptomyces sp. I4(2020)]MBJ6613804.1 sigma-70 family RNA polymerase sigma factor [Streptomyces sp. I3(2020)]MBJ6628843.1 sigma-70 family RNA polymerase sigma factor [Streptomyces sp. I4(2020)]
MTEQAQTSEAVRTAEPFDTFFARSFPGMTARALLLCGHPQDAEDAVQEAYAAAFSRWERLCRYDAPDAWVYRIVRQRLWAVARDRSRTRLAEPDSFQPPPAAGVEQTVEARAVLTALARLPSRQRTVLVLNCLEGMTQQAIADELGLTRGAVAASVFKARAKLMKAVGMTDRADKGNGRRAAHGRHDDLGLVPSQATARLRDQAAAPADPVVAALRRTELWLRAAVARSDRPARQLAAVRVASAGSEAAQRCAAAEADGARSEAPEAEKAAGPGPAAERNGE